MKTQKTCYCRLGMVTGWIYRCTRYRKTRLGMLLMLLLFGCLLLLLLQPLRTDFDITRSNSSFQSPVFTTSSAQNPAKMSLSVELQSSAQNPAKMSLSVALQSSAQNDAKKSLTVAERFKERQERARRKCHDRTRQTADIKWIADRTEVGYRPRDYLYCPVLKVASTFWTRFFHSLRTNKDSPFDVDIKEALESSKQFLSKMLPITSAKTQRFLNESVKLMFVRDPFARIFSAYIDKLFAPNPYYWKEIGVRTIRKYRKSGSRRMLCGHDVTFPEVVKYVTRSSSAVDGHFKPIHTLCGPCELNYNFIGKMETFYEDMPFITRLFGRHINEDVLPIWKYRSSVDAMEDSTNSPFEWKTDIRKCISFYEAAKKIWHKMQIRGLVRRDISMPFTETEIDNVTAKEFIKALKSGAGENTNYLRRQKQDILTLAWTSVPDEDVRAFRETFRRDFELFDYDIHGDHIFNRGQTDIKHHWLFNLSNT